MISPDQPQFFTDGDNDPVRQPEAGPLAADKLVDAHTGLQVMERLVKEIADDHSRDINVEARAYALLYQFHAVQSARIGLGIHLSPEDSSLENELMHTLEALSPVDAS